MATLNYGSNPLIPPVAPDTTISAAPATPPVLPPTNPSFVTAKSTPAYSVPAASIADTGRVVVPNTSTGVPVAASSIVNSTANLSALAAQLEAAKQAALKIQGQIPTATGLTPSGGGKTPNGATVDAQGNLVSPGTPYTPTDSQISQNQQGEQNLMTQITDWVKQLVGLSSNRPSAAEEQAKMADQYKLQDSYNTLAQLTSDVKAYRDQYNAVTQEMNTALENLTGQGRGIPTALLEGQAAKIQRQYNIQLAGISAQMGASAANAEMIRGNMSTAQALIKNVVDAKMYDYDSQIKDLQNLVSMNTTVYNALDTSTRALINQRIQDQKDAATVRREELSKIGDLAIKYNAYGAGIDINNDTLQQAQEKASRVAGTADKVGVPKTEGERTASLLSQYAAKFQSGGTTPDGTPIYDGNGDLTPGAWQQAMASAQMNGISRETFIKEFGHLIPRADDGSVSSKYGLTAKELALIG